MDERQYRYPMKFTIRKILPYLLHKLLHIQSPAQVYHGNNRKQEFIQFSESCTFAIFNTLLGESSEHVYIVERYTYGKINYRFDEKSTCYIITSLR